MSGYQLMASGSFPCQTTGSIVNGGTCTSTAGNLTCPAGKKAMSAGWANTSTTTTARQVGLLSSIPAADGSGWSFIFVDISGGTQTANTITLSTWMVCAAVS